MRKTKDLYPELHNISGRKSQYEYVKGMFRRHCKDDGFYLTEHLANQARDLVASVICGTWINGKGKQQHDRPSPELSRTVKVRSLEYFRPVVEYNEHGIPVNKMVKTKSPIAWKLPAQELQKDPRPEDIADAAKRNIDQWTSAPDFDPEDRLMSLEGAKDPYSGELTLYDALHLLKNYGKHCNPAVRSQNLKKKKWRYEEVPPATRKDLANRDKFKPEAKKGQAK